MSRDTQPTIEPNTCLACRTCLSDEISPSCACGLTYYCSEECRIALDSAIGAHACEERERHTATRTTLTFCLQAQGGKPQALLICLSAQPRKQTRVLSTKMQKIKLPRAQKRQKGLKKR